MGSQHDNRHYPPNRIFCYHTTMTIPPLVQNGNDTSIDIERRRALACEITGKEVITKERVSQIISTFTRLESPTVSVSHQLT
jgi:hypothetical protein